MLQIVRADALARVRRSQDHGTSYVDSAQLAALALDQLSSHAASPPPLAQRVAQTNLRSLQQCGVSKLEAVLSDIHADRNRAYASLGAAAPTHAHISDTAHETAFANAGNRDEKPESKAGYCGSIDTSHMDPSLRKCNDI
jgi:hypothetical protein